MLANFKETEVSSSSKIEILIGLLREVEEFGPERILAAEVREGIKSAVLNGLGLLAELIQQEAQETGRDPNTVSPFYQYGWSDFVRTAFTNPPLPDVVTNYPEGEAPLEAHLADCVDWSAVISDEQQEALWRILKEGFGLDLQDTQEDVLGLDDLCVVKSEQILSLDGGVKFKPALFVTGDGGKYLSCYIIEGEG